MKSAFGRRDFFKLTGVTLALASCQRSFNFPFFESVPEQELFYSGYWVGKVSAKDTNPDQEVGLFINGESIKKRIPLKNEIHSIEYSKDLDVKVFIPKLGASAYYQVGQGEIIELPAVEGYHYYGHGHIDNKRKRLYLTKARVKYTRKEIERRDEPGFIYSYSLPDFKLAEVFTSHGFDPHDILMSEDKIIVCNGGTNSRVSIIDPDNKSLVKEYKLNSPHLTLRHIEKIDDKNFCIGPLTIDQNKPCPPIVLNLDSGFRHFDTSYLFDMANSRKQILSILHHDGHIYATCPGTNSALVYTVEGKFIGGVIIDSCSSLVYSKRLKGVVAGSGEYTEAAKLLTVKDGKLNFESISWAHDLIGSHATIVEA